MTKTMYKIDETALRTLGVQRGAYSLAAIARVSGLTRQTLYNVLRNDKSFSARTLASLCEALDCEPNDILVAESNGDGAG